MLSLHWDDKHFTFYTCYFKHYQIYTSIRPAIIRSLFFNPALNKAFLMMLNFLFFFTRSSSAFIFVFFSFNKALTAALTIAESLFFRLGLVLAGGFSFNEGLLLFIFFLKPLKNLLSNASILRMLHPTINQILFYSPSFLPHSCFLCTSIKA